MLESMRFYQLAPFFDNSSKFFFSTSTSSFNTTSLTPLSISQLLSINSIGYPEFQTLQLPVPCNFHLFFSLQNYVLVYFRPILNH